MSQILFFLSGLFLGGAAVWSYMKTCSEKKEDVPKEQEKGKKVEEVPSLKKHNTQRQEKMDKNKERILERIKKEGHIKTGDVQEMFNVSRSTAYRYLSELEEMGRVEQTRDHGRKVRYILVK